MWEQNKAQISENQSVFLVNIEFLSSLLRNSFYIECILYKTSDRISSPQQTNGHSSNCVLAKSWNMDKINIIRAKNTGFEFIGLV